MKTYKEYTSEPEPWQHLAMSIIEQAFLDLRPLSGNRKCRKAKQIDRNSAIHFIRSDWCKTLLTFSDTHIDHDTIVLKGEEAYAEKASS